MGERRGSGEGLDARLRSISALFFVVSVAVLLVSASTPLRFDEDIGEGAAWGSTR